MKVCGLSDESEDVEGRVKRYAAPPRADVPSTIRGPVRDRKKDMLGGNGRRGSVHLRGY